MDLVHPLTCELELPLDTGDAIAFVRDVPASLSQASFIRNLVYQAGPPVTVALFSNRLGVLHNWTAVIEELPSDSNASLYNAQGAGSTVGSTPQVANCLRLDDDGACSELNTIRFEPDMPGRYQIKVTAELPGGDELGPTVATHVLAINVSGESDGGGCRTVDAPASWLALVFLLGLAAIRRR